MRTNTSTTDTTETDTTETDVTEDAFLPLDVDTDDEDDTPDDDDSWKDSVSRGWDDGFFGDGEDLSDY